MFAKIKHDNSVYYSPVFAVSLKYAKCHAIVFDHTFSQLIVIEVFKGNKYTALFMDYNTDNFSINEDNFKSYWNDTNIFKTIKQKKYSPQMLTEAKQMLRLSAPQEFTVIKTGSDLQALEIDSGAFHDGYVMGMCEKNGMLEILLNTSWGAFIILRCRGILENSLVPGDMFSWCDMRRDCGYVELAFESMSFAKETVLKAEHIEYKPLFEHRLDYNSFDYSFSGNRLMIRDKHCRQPIEINGAIDILDFCNQNTLGYFENDDFGYRCNIFSSDIVYSYFKYKSKDAQKAGRKILQFYNDIAEHGFHFEQMHFYDECCEDLKFDFGELLYTQEYGAVHKFLYLSQFFIPIFSLYNGIWCIIRLGNPQASWTPFLFMGLGVSLVSVLLVLIASSVGTFIEKRSGNLQKHCLEIYENGLKYKGYNVSFNIDYASITKVEHKRHITIETVGVKHKLHKTKNDQEIYAIIAKKVNSLPS